nr:16S rRNA (guanine(966)-N(2))-methyltransferase RsmD [Actinomycetales bacterium]
MSRIISGEFRGRTLAVPKSGTRPTSDRVREAIFSALDSRDAIRGARVLDLYAGSGALGFEALSRGAAHLTSVDAARPAASVIRANAHLLGVRPTVITAKTATILAAGISRVSGAPFGLVFLDPPYGHAVDGDLAALADGDWLTEGALVVVEGAARSPSPAFPARLGEPTEKRYGDTVVWFAQARDLGGGLPADGPTTLGA